MRSLFIKVTAILLAMVLGFGSADFAATKVKADEIAATETKISGEEFLKEVIGEYVPLFEGATFEEKYDHYWHDYSAAVAGESVADMCVSMMKAAIGASAYGDEAGEEFFCGFTADVERIAFGGDNGTDITFTLKNGKTVKHTYSFVKDATASGIVEGMDWGVDGYLYKSNDDNKDEFTYIFMCPDTPAKTYHLEFRYGDSEENVLKLTEGKYKNWLAAGLSVSAFDDPKETLLQQVIGLFVIENVSAMTGEECNAQRASISGFWDMDTTAFKDYPGYENASMFIKLTCTGTGKSYVDMTGSGSYLLASEYPFYSYGVKDTAGKETGVYIVMSDDEGVKTATYDVTEKDGRKVLTFNSSEGILTYYERDAVAPGAASITKAVKKGKKLILKWAEADYADGYEILVSSSKKFKKAKTVIVEGNTKTKIKKLKKDTYYVKMRAYTVDAAGNKVYGEYSDVKVVKTK